MLTPFGLESKGEYHGICYCVNNHLSFVFLYTCLDKIMSRIVWYVSFDKQRENEIVFLYREKFVNIDTESAFEQAKVFSDRIAGRGYRTKMWFEVVNDDDISLTRKQLTVMKDYKNSKVKEDEPSFLIKTFAGACLIVALAVCFAFLWG